MAQATYTPIQLYRSGTGSAVPTAGNLLLGELGLNYTDGRLYYEDNLGDVQILGAKMTSAIAAFLSTPTSANLASAVTNETGSGALVFATSPTLVTPALGTPASGVLTNCTGLPLGSVTGLGTGVETLLASPTAANLGAAVTGMYGEYTPFLTGITNVNTVELSDTFFWFRVDKAIFVFGQANVDFATAGAVTRFGVELPIARNFTTINGCSGVAVAGAHEETMAIRSDPTNDRADVNGIAATAAAHTMAISFAYQLP